MDLTLTTPALLFPAISLLFLAYTNKYLALSSLIRSLHRDYQNDRGNKLLEGQIVSLRKRVAYIRQMQSQGILSFIFCVATMFLLYARQELIASIIFGFSLLALFVSLVICALEIHKSGDALNMQIADMEDGKH